MSDKLIWGVLVHLGTNLWYEVGNTRGVPENSDNVKVWNDAASTKLRFDMATFDRLLQKFKSSGVNTIILDIAEGLRYESHPELAIEGSLSRAQMEVLLSKLYDMGFDVIPKLNFSTTHDAWLGEYSRMVSTSVYYKVCRDLIEEVCDIFKPKYLHLGMDEEGIDCQSKFDYIVIRNNDLWWQDLYYLVECVESCGVRAMMWSDYARHHLEEFVEKCPKSVVQCVWYYFNKFGEDMEEMHEIRVRPYAELNKHGFDQLPVGSIEYDRDNFEKLCLYCKDVISEEHLLGFGTTTWASTLPEWEEFISVAADTVAESIEAYES